MNTYTPDSWVIVEIFDPSETATGPIYKVLGGWSGSYANSSTYRLNSGITKVTREGCQKDDDETFYMHGHSGSVYEGRMYRYGLKMSTAPIANALTNLGCKILNEPEALDVLYRFTDVQ